MTGLLVLTAACGGDDGEDRPGVKVIDESGSVSGSVSGSGSGTGSASGSATGTGSGSSSGTSSASASTTAPTDEDSDPTVFDPIGGYQPVSDVVQHSRVVLDVAEINALLGEEPYDFDAIRAIYDEGGNSLSSSGDARTLAGYALKERDEDIWNTFVAYYDGDQDWLDTFVRAAIDGTGPFEGESDAVRRQGIQKGIMNQIMISWTLHEVVAALAKAEDGNFDPAKGAPHNWDEGWAFYHGDDPGNAPFATADKRGGNFGTGDAVNQALLTAFEEGKTALVAGDAAAAQVAADEVIRLITITYVQATIRYSTLVERDLEAGDDAKARTHQAEGWAFYRVIEPLVADIDAAAAAEIAGILDLVNPPSAVGASVVLAALESVYADLGIAADEVGTLQ